MAGPFHELRLAVRTLTKSPATTAVIIGTLALAMTASTVIYSLIDIVWHVIPAQDRNRLVFVASTDSRQAQAQAGVSGGVARTGVSLADLEDWTAQNTTFDAFAGFDFETVNLTGVEVPISVSAVGTTANLFSVWGIQPVIGRAFRSEESTPGAERVAMVTHAFWQRQFPDAQVLGRPLILNGEAHTVIGVLPPEAGVGIFRQVAVIVPLVVDTTRAPRDERRLFVTGRLKPGITRAQGAAELDTIARRLQTAYPSTNTQIGVVVRPLIELVGGNTPFILFLLGLIAGLLLVIACANVINVILAHSTARRREFAIRAALGASRRHHLKQLLTEGLVASALAGAAALLLVPWCLRLISWTFTDALLGNEMTVNGRVLAFSLLATFLAPLGFALLPAWRSSSTDPEELKQGSRSGGGGTHGRRLRQLLVGGQVALALLLLIEIGLLARTAWALRNLEKGFDPAQVLTLRIELSPSKYTAPGEIRAFFDRLLDRLEQLPGVQSVGSVGRLPIADREVAVRFSIEGRPVPTPGSEPWAARAAIGRGYLRTMRIPVVQGRDFTRADSADAPRIALASQELVRRYFPNADPIGRRIRFEAADEWVEIAGVVGDVRNSNAGEAPSPHVYVPTTQLPERSVAIVVRTEGVDPLSLTPAIRTEVSQIDRDQIVHGVSSMEQVLFDDLAGTYMLTGVLAAMALVALGLAAAGIYGVMAYSVSQRAREIGIRMALGAQAHAVLKMVLAQGLFPVLLGGLLGLIGGFVLVSVTASAIGDVNPNDPLAYVTILLFLAGVAFLASYLPARRALQVDPAVALRSE